MATDENLDVNDASAAPTQLTRRALLKELSKAPGVMGALLLPTTWVTPLMEFTLGATSVYCSATGGWGSCSGSVLSLPFPSGDPSAVTFAAAWYGLLPGNAITATLDRAGRKVRVTLAAPFSFGVVPAGGVATLDSTGATLSWAFTDASSPKVSLALKVGTGTANVLCSRNTTQDNFSMDLQVTGTAAAYTLAVNNFRSTNC